MSNISLLMLRASREYIIYSTFRMIITAFNKGGILYLPDR